MKTNSFKARFLCLFGLLLPLLFSASLLTGQGNYPTDFECYVELPPPGGPETTAPYFSYFGRQFTPRGVMRILLVYAGFDGYGPGSSYSLDQWDNSLVPFPEYVDVDNQTTTRFLFNNEGDFDNETITNDPENQRSCSYSLNLMSKPNQDFRLIADIFRDNNGEPAYVSIAPNPNWNSWTDINRAVLEEMETLNTDPNYWAQFDNRENTPDFESDNTLSSSDGIIDYIVLVYRYNYEWPTPEPIQGMSTWSGSRGGQNLHNIDGCTNCEYHGLSAQDGFTVTRGGGVPQLEVFMHEFGHAMYFAPHICGTNGVVGNYFIRPATGLGMTANPGIFYPMLNAWERWLMEYIDPIEINQNGVYNIGDYVSTGDAIRIAIPNFGLYTDQPYLWIENHQGKGHSLDNHQLNGEIIGPNGVEVPNSSLGVYMFVENIENEQVSVSTPLGYSNFFSGGANGIKMINASGNWDFPPDLNVPVETNYWTNVLYRFEKQQANPVSGQSPWHYHRYDGYGDLDGDGQPDSDGVIGLDTDANSTNGVNEGGAIAKEWIGNQDQYLYRWMGGEQVAGNLRTPAFVAGDELSIGSNPTILNYPQYSSGSMGTYYLNGLFVKILSIDSQTGVASIEVKFEETRVEEDIRWCGKIVLPNITEDSNPDLILAAGKELLLDLGKTADKADIDLTTGDFVSPSVLTISNGSKLYLEANSKLIVDNYSKLIIESGAEVYLEDGASIVVEETGILELRSNNLILDGDNAALIVKGSLLTSDNVDFSFTGEGFARFYSTHSLSLGAGSDFILIGEGKDHRFLELMDETEIKIESRALYLEDGKSIYHENSRISVTDGDVDIKSCTLTGVGFFSGQGQYGLHGAALKSCYIRLSTIKLLNTGVYLEGPSAVSTFFNNDIQQCNQGVVGTQLDWIGFYSNDFADNEEASIKLEGVNTLNSEFTEIDYGGYSNGYDLTAVSFAYIKKGHVRYCENGIKATESNIFLSEGLTIEGCQNGVWSENELADKALSVGRCLCANIINNDTGVLGTNVILDIDGFVHQYECDLQEPLPNRFDGNTIIFDLCYTDPGFNGNIPILMRYNYWGGMGLNSYDYKIQHGDNECPPYPSAAVPVDFSDYVSDPQELVNCSSYQYEPSPIEPLSPSLSERISCQRTIDNVLYDVHEQSKEAWQELQDSVLVDALSFYTPISELKGDTTLGDICNQKVDFSYCMAQGLTFPGARFSENFGIWAGSNKSVWNKVVREGGFIIAPNPSDQNFNIYGPPFDEGIQIYFFDQLGKLAYQCHYEPGISIGTDQFAGKGLYFAIIRKDNGELVHSQKMVIR